MSSTPRSNGDYISVPNPVTTSPNDTSDITPPDISNSSSAATATTATTTTATATADPDHIAPAPDPTTDSDPALTANADQVVIDVQLSELQMLHDALVVVVTEPLFPHIPLKPPFLDLPRKAVGMHSMENETAGLLPVEVVERLRVSDRDNAAMLRKSILRLFIGAAVRDLSANFTSGYDEWVVEKFYGSMIFLSRRLANENDLIDEDRIVVARTGLIVYSLSHLFTTLIDFEVELSGKMVSFFAPAIYGAFFTMFLAFKFVVDPLLPELFGRLRLSQDDFKRLLPVIEAELLSQVVPRGATHCTTYIDAIKSMDIAESRGICTYVMCDKEDSIVHGFWVEAESKGSSKLVFRNLECPGGDECPISCDQVQRVLRYKGDKGGGTKSKKKKVKKSNAMIHKKFTVQTIESGKDDMPTTKEMTFGYCIKQEEEDDGEDADNADNADKADKAGKDSGLGGLSESDGHDFQKSGLMIPKDFIQSSVSRGMFGFKRLPLMIFWHMFVIGMPVVMFLLAFGVIKPDGSSGSAAANNADSSGNGNNTTAVENIVSSGNVTNFFMHGITYLASNASAIIAVISATSLPAAFGILTWIRESLFLETTYFELLAAKAAVTSFKKACKLKGVCPGCLMAAVLRNRAALMLLAFGQFAGLVGATNLEPTAAKMCFDCHGTTTCLFRAGMHFVQAFAVYNQDTDEMVEEMSGRYRLKLPKDCTAWTRYCSKWNKKEEYYWARPNKAFLVREILGWSGVVLVGYVDILNNKVGRLTYFKEPIIVRPLSTPMIDFQYLM